MLFTACWCFACVALELGELPILVFSEGNARADEIIVGLRREVPVVFQYRISPAGQPYDTQHYPWVLDEDTKVKPGATCAALIANQFIRVSRAVGGTVEQKKLEPIPVSQMWNGNTLATDNPGIVRSRVSACCRQDNCLDRCLRFPTGETWILEINAPQWGVAATSVVKANQGGSYTLTTPNGDPGVWPVMRIPCLYCPIVSCITNCSNGQYSTGYSSIVVSAQRRNPNALS